MHFDLKLWRMTSGLRSRIALSAALGLLALAVGIARFAFLGQFLAGVFRGETLILPLLAAAAAILLAWFDHRRSRRTASASRHRHAAFKSFGEEFLDAVQGLPTLKAFGQSAAYGRMLATKARALSDSTFWALSLNVLTRAFTDLGTAFGSAAALALGAYRVRHGEMSIEALLIVLMAGTEIFRPLRDISPSTLMCISRSSSSIADPSGQISSLAKSSIGTSCKAPIHPRGIRNPAWRVVMISIESRSAT